MISEDIKHDKKKDDDSFMTSEMLHSNLLDVQQT